MQENEKKNILLRLWETAQDKSFWKETIRYIVASFAGFVLNIGVYALLTEVVGVNVSVSSVIAWLLSLFFLYAMHSKLVFKIKHGRFSEVVKRFLGFAASRVGAEVFEIVLLNVTIVMLGWANLPSKILISFLAALINYSFSKLLIFRKKDNRDYKTETT